MIMLGPKKDRGTIVANILEKKQHGNMEYVGEDYKQHEKKEEENSQELDNLVYKVMQAIQANDLSTLKHALKDVIKMCSKEQD